MVILDGLDQPQIVVDSHAHLGPANEPGEDGGRGARLLAEMDAVGVDFTCLFASAGRGSDYPRETELIIEISEATSGRIVPFARIHPFWRSEGVEDLRRLAKAGVRGLKLHPFMDGAFMPNDPELVHPLMGIASEFGLIVLIHSGWGWNSAPGLIVDLARSFPEVTTIMGHAGRYGMHREAAILGAGVPNLYFDVAGLAIPGGVEELVAAVGAEHVLFGSDHPYAPVGFELEKVARWTRLSPAERGLIIGGNAARLLELSNGGRVDPVAIPAGPRGAVNN